MALSVRLRTVLDWLLEGYPAGVPPTDYIPLLALLRRGLTEDEVAQVAAEISARGSDLRDVGVSITKITDAVPDEQDVARVEAHLHRFHDWPTEP